MNGLHAIQLSETIMPGHTPKREFIEVGKETFPAYLRGFVAAAQLRLAPGAHSQAKDPIDSYLSDPKAGPLVFRGAEWRCLTVEFLE